MSDALDLLQWKNDWRTRQYALETERMILWSPHLVWLERRLKKPDFYIIEYGGDKIGDLRFEQGDTIEVSIRLAPAFRGTGLGKQAVQLGCRIVQPKYGKDLTARIVDGNIASMRTFTACGFVPSAHQDDPKPHHTLTRTFAVKP